MKVLGNNLGIIEVDRIYHSYAYEHIFVYEGKKKKYIWCGEVIPDLGIYSHYFAQQSWKKYTGDIYESVTVQPVNFKNNSAFSYHKYILVNDELVPADEISFIGQLKLNKGSEYFFKIDKGVYNAYTLNDDFRVLLELKKNEYVVFDLFKTSGYYFFELLPNHNICWNESDLISNSFIASDPKTDIAVKHRKSKIKNILK